MRDTTIVIIVAVADIVADVVTIPVPIIIAVAANIVADAVAITAIAADNDSSLG